MISYVWPEPQSSAAGLRSLNVIQGLRQAGYRVVIASAAQNEGGKAACDALAFADPQGVQVRSIRLNDASFDSWVAELAPQWVIFDRFVVEEQFGARVRQHSPEAVCILDTQDLHFLRLSREQSVRRAKQQGQSIGDSDVRWDRSMVARELAAIHRVDLSWLVSDFEMKLLTREFGVDCKRLAVSRFAYPKRTGTRAEFSGRKGFAMLGNFRHAPNLDAFRWLRAEIWPAIRSLLANAEIHIFGAYPPKEVMQAHAPRDGFFVHGPAENLGQVFDSVRVSLAPLRFGAGIKGKISDSWWHGVPVVSTPLGAEGMTGPGAEWGGAVASTVEDFARACVAHHEDLERWQEARERGDASIEELFSEERFFAELEGDLKRAHAAKASSEVDWMRQMLVQSSVDAYRYFGRWLELKQQRDASGGKAQ